jgi:DNA-binding MarR family transcriptional regulator
MAESGLGRVAQADQANGVHGRIVSGKPAAGHLGPALEIGAAWDGWQNGAMTVPSPDNKQKPIDSSVLESFVGYNARRASLVIIDVFLKRMAVHDLRTVDFSILSLIAHNPGITSRQLASSLSLLPPNVVGLVNAIEKRGLIKRQPHPLDGRAVGLHLTAKGEKFVAEAEKTAERLELEATSALTVAERKTLIRLLQKVYRG